MLKNNTTISYYISRTSEIFKEQLSLHYTDMKADISTRYTRHFHVAIVSTVHNSLGLPALKLSF